MIAIWQKKNNKIRYDYVVETLDAGGNGVLVSMVDGDAVGALDARVDSCCQ